MPNAIMDVKGKINLPEGFDLRSGSLVLDAEIIEPGENISSTIITTKNIDIVEPPETEIPDTEIPDTEIPEEEVPETEVPKPESPESEPIGEKEIPQTGDNIHVYIWLVLAVLSAIVILFVIRKMVKKGNVSLFILLLLCGILVTPHNTQAKVLSDTFTVSHNLAVGSEEIIIEAEFSYSYREEQEMYSIFTLNEDGFFVEAFSKTIDLSKEAEFSELAMSLFYNDLSESNKEILNNIQKVEEVYNSASLTFYPNGKARVTYEISDTVYNAFSESFFFNLIMRKSSNKLHDYEVDIEKGLITLIDGGEYLLNLEEESICGQGLLLANEIFRYDGEVEALEEEEDKEKENYTVMGNVPYGVDETDIRNQMDVYIPNNLDSTEENGAFIIIYGGSWTGGSKEDVIRTAQKYASEGYLAVAINMHNAYHNEETEKTEVTVFDMLDDVHRSIKKLKSLSDENNWNITQIATSGYSSGANIAMLYGFSRGSTETYFNTEEVLPVKFVVNVVGPVDMHDTIWASDPDWPEDEHMHEPGSAPIYAYLLTGAVNHKDYPEEEDINAMSPIYYVENYGGLPTVMGYSKTDPIVNPRNGSLLQEYLNDKNVQNNLFTFPNSIHSYNNDPEEAKAFYDKIFEYAETYFN